MNDSGDDRNTSRPTHRRTGCIYYIVIAFLIVVFLCGVVAAAYLVFPPPATNLLVVGVDTYSRDYSVSELDSFLLLQIDPAKLQTQIISLEGHHLSDTTQVRSLDALPDYASSLWQVPVDGVIVVDYDLFVRAIDAVGGVRIYVERMLEDANFPTDIEGVVKQMRFESGWQVMGGERTLNYTRIVKPDSDEKRSARQRQVVMALGERLVNPIDMLAMTDIMREMRLIDISMWDIVRLVPAVIAERGRFSQDSLVVPSS